MGVVYEVGMKLSAPAGKGVGFWYYRMGSKEQHSLPTSLYDTYREPGKQRKQERNAESLREVVHGLKVLQRLLPLPLHFEDDTFHKNNNITLTTQGVLRKRL